MGESHASRFEEPLLRSGNRQGVFEALDRLVIGGDQRICGRGQQGQPRREGADADSWIARTWAFASVIRLVRIAASTRSIHIHMA